MEAVSQTSSAASTAPTEVPTTESGATAVKEKHCHRGHRGAERGISESIATGGCIPSDSSQGSAIDDLTEKFTEIIDHLISSFQSMFEGFLKLLNDKLNPTTPPDAGTETPPADEDPPVGGETSPAPNPDPGTGTAPPSDDTPPVDDTSDTGDTPPADDKCDCGNETDETAKTLNKTGDFLWKPVSDKDGKLAILLPPRLSKSATSVRILDKDGKVLASGEDNKLSKEDGRRVFRFKRAGKGYPDGCVVEITRKNGTVIKQEIKESSKEFRK